MGSYPCRKVASATGGSDIGRGSNKLGLKSGAKHQTYTVERSNNGSAYVVIGTTKDTVIVDNEVQKRVKPYLSNRHNVSVNYRVRAKSEWFDDDSTKKCQYSDYSDVVSISGNINASFGKFGLDQITPDSYSLSQNFPNPFNPSTTIRYGAPEPAIVDLSLFDIMGRAVMNEHLGYVVAGYHDYILNSSSGGRQLSSGIYMYTVRLTGESGAQKSFTKKMHLLK